MIIKRDNISVRKKVILIVTLILTLVASSSLIYLNNPTVKKKALINKYNPTTLAEKCRGDFLDGEAKSTQSRHCYFEYFEAMMDIKGPKETVETLKKFAEESKGLNGECHSVGHLIGKYAWKSYGTKSFDGDITACAFSYGHGILQQASSEAPKELLKEKFIGICKNTEDKPGCLHGFGHTVRDLDFGLVESVEYCNLEAASVANWGNSTQEDKVQTCMEGYVMEDFVLRNLYWITVSDINEVVKFCDGISGAPWGGCVGSAIRNYVVAPDGITDSKYLEKRDERLVLFKNFCESQKSQDLIHRCMNYVGLTAAEVYTLDMIESITAPKAEEFCSGSETNICFSAFINSRWNRLGNNQDRVKPLCEAMRNEKNKKLCRYIVSQQGVVPE